MNDDRIPRVYVYSCFTKSGDYQLECTFVYNWVALNHAGDLVKQAEEMGIDLTITVVNDNLA